MRTCLWLSLLLAAPALADVGPRPPPCSVPEGCVSCVSMGGDPTVADCRSGALAKGLVRSDCSDRRGAELTEYFCPANTPARRCGCGATDAAVWAVAAVLMLRRRRPT